MRKKITLALYLAAVIILTAPIAAQAYTSGVEHVGEDTTSFLASPFAAAFDPTHQGTRPPMHPQAGEDTASFLSSSFVAAFDPAPQVPRPPVYQYPVQPPPGMCRWERQVLDRSGRPVIDPAGRPLREYTIGPCWRPPY